MRSICWPGRALCAALLAGSLIGCEFITAIESNPNRVPEAQLDQLLVGVSVNNFWQEEGQCSRMASMWTQQMAGTQRQFSGFDVYNFTEGDASGCYTSVYTGGGLIDIREAIAVAEEQGRTAYAGIFKVYEAFMIGQTASVFGDIEYSQAVNPEFDQPVLDEQSAVYAAVQSLLDEAISNLGGGGTLPGGADLIYGGSTADWIAAAYTMKARFHLHWVEAEGNGRYTSALAAAANGISSASGDFLAQHSTANTETTAWFQFMRDRSGYMTAGKFLVDALLADSDPRLPFYFDYGDTPYDAEHIGSGPGENLDAASKLAVAGSGAPDWDFPMVTCAENYFIIAEAEYVTGTEAAARTALDAAIACDAATKGVDLSAQQAANDALTGAALFDEIMLQKYKALFLNREVWNDYKRTCRPAITPYDGGPVPGRLFYDENSRQTNVNIPDTGQQPARNDNDPNICP
jgi:hypothetical protein